MQRIVLGRQDYLKFLAVSKVENGVYRPSKNLLYLETEDGLLLCNTLTGTLVLLSLEEEALFRKLPQKAYPEMAELIKQRFVVPDACDEAGAEEQLRALLNRRLEALKTIQYYNILPTTCCNAHCFYCFESEMPHVNMSEETAEKLARFIAENHGHKSVVLSWFGGEPTLGKARIDQICHRLSEQDISFESNMVSNGFLFDAELVKHAKAVWNLKKIQITLDGTEQIYNRTKAYQNVRDNPYQRVLRNIGYFAEAEIYVDIRLNLDCHNAENLTELIEELSERFQDREYLRIYVRQLNEDDGFDPIQHGQDDLEKLKQQLISLQELLAERGWNPFEKRALPELRVSTCMADDPSSVQCTPEGILSKCEDLIYSHTVGSLDEGITDLEEMRWWRQRRQYEGCESCPLAPGCIRLMKNCPLKQSPCTAYEKERTVSGYYEATRREFEAWKAAAHEE